ncbi:MAG: response regulator transcription factor [Dehalococcoidia bacterium]|jgi:DNA-binding NarL/FixJ family response regulator|nr:response regulator transcription factor [Dehalococcoidia bacterium]MDP6511531.1 response regulator transcription factor [Dehalococcoidia bacterium]
MTLRTRVLIVDGNLIFRQALSRGLDLEAGIEVVGDTGDKEQALYLLRLMSPHVVILDGDAGAGAMETAVRIRRFAPGVSTVLLTSSLRDEDLYMAIRAGVAAYLRKSLGMQDMVNAIGSVTRGERPITEWLRTRPKVASLVLEQFQDFSMDAVGERARNTVTLSDRELEILGYIAQGNPNRRIANLLGIKEQSIKNYVTTILHKLSANDRTHAVSIALKRGWIESD